MAADRLVVGGPGAVGGRAGATAGRVLQVGRHPLAVAAARRLALSIPLLLLVSALLFVLLSIVPGDPTEAILGPRATGTASPEQYDALARQLGIDQSLPSQYWHWLSSALQGDLGNSITTNQSVAQAIGQRFETTLSLTIGALLVSLVLGVGLGVASAVWRGPLGRAVDVVSVLGFTLPAFWIAAELIVLFAVKLGWFPATGYVALSDSPTQWLRSLVLPVLALAALPTGVFAKYTRDAMLDVLASEHVRTARANGIPNTSIIWINALKPASLQVVTIAGLTVVGMLTSTVFVESVFGLPGLGSLIVNAATSHDAPTVEGVAVVFTLIVVVVNLVVDLLYTALSPKVRAV